jgi:hypothetical protein
MEARRIIDGAAFGPEVLQVIRDAFDDAWRNIEIRFPVYMHLEARKMLAKAVMSAAREDSSDSAMIRDAAVRAMRRSYPQFLEDHPISLDRAAIE